MAKSDNQKQESNLLTIGMITDAVGWHKVLLLINHNHYNVKKNKSRTNISNGDNCWCLITANCPITLSDYHCTEWLVKNEAPNVPITFEELKWLWLIMVMGPSGVQFVP